MSPPINPNTCQATPLWLRAVDHHSIDDCTELALNVASLLFTEGELHG